MAQVTVRKRGKVWEYRFEMARVGGERKQSSRSGFRTKADALCAGNAALSEYNQCGFAFVPTEISYSDFLDHWMQSYCRAELSPVTCEGYEKRIKNHIKPELGKYRLQALSTEVIQQFLYQKYHAGLSRNSLISLKGILSGSLKYAVQTLKVLHNNPARDAHIPASRTQARTPPHTIKRTCITQEQIEEILHRFPYGSSCHIPILFAYRCGLRRGEAFAVAWQDIDFEAGILTVNRQMQYVDKKLILCPPKYESYRKIRLDSYMMKTLQAVRAEQESNKINYGEFYVHNYEDTQHRISTVFSEGAHEVDFVNVREDGTYIQRRVEMHAARVIHHELGLKEYNFHSLRHTHATMLAEKGALPKDVQNRLGHKNINVTMQIYVHLTKEMEDISVGILDGIPMPDIPSKAG